MYDTAALVPAPIHAHFRVWPVDLDLGTVAEVVQRRIPAQEPQGSKRSTSVCDNNDHDNVDGLGVRSLQCDFQTVPAEWQTPAAVLVPVFKIIQKNVLCRLLCGQDDVKPELVTFNVDVTNALFISSTMQNLQSVKSSAMLIVVDFMQMLASLFDLRLMLNGIRDATNESTDQAIACALMVALKYPELGSDPC